MQTRRLKLELAPHPAHPPLGVQGVTARVRLDPDGWLLLRWRVERSARLVVPKLAGRSRADGLWQTTCFEMFCRCPGAAGYVELNLSPSERWAAYDFTGYRAGMVERGMSRAPVITPRRGGDLFMLDAAVRLADLPPPPWELSLTAVLEEEGLDNESEAKSFWAATHPRGQPDFHHPDCFTLELPPPDAP